MLADFHIYSKPLCLSPAGEVQTDQSQSTQTNSNITPVVTVSYTLYCAQYVVIRQADSRDADVSGLCNISVYVFSFQCFVYSCSVSCIFLLKCHQE